MCLTIGSSWKRSWPKLDFLDETIEELSAEIDRLIALFANEVDLLDAITGVDRAESGRG